MPGRSPKDRDALLVKLSALLDAELPEAEQNQLFDAMSQDPELLAAFEALAHTRASFQALAAPDADALTAAVMAAVDPDTMPASPEGALALASRALDGGSVADATLDAALSTPHAADAVLGFISANELVRAGGAAVAAAPELADALRPVADRVDAAVASSERAGVLALAHADAALSAAEVHELDGLWGRLDDAALTLPLTAPVLREALVVARDSAAFERHARRAGDAAVQAVEALARHAPPKARPTDAQPAQPVARASFFVQVWQSLSVARLPLAFAGAAAALFFAVRAPAPGDQPSTPAVDKDTIAQALVDALAPTLLQEGPRPAELPLLADNEADVEALDANGTTMVFSTSESNITVIWVAGEDDEGEEQGT